MARRCISTLNDDNVVPVELLGAVPVQSSRTPMVIGFLLCLFLYAFNFNGTSCVSFESYSYSFDMSTAGIAAAAAAERSLIPTETSRTQTQTQYNLSGSTEDNYKSAEIEFHGRYQSIRSALDYGYHKHYTLDRQLVQDSIIASLQKDNQNIKDSDGNSCISPKNPWIVFTAGAMGSGKSHTIRYLAAQNHFPLDTFVTVDPDEIRRLLPEFELYLEHNPEMAGENTMKEAGFIAEILTQVALKAGKNVLVDGSLKDAEWYRNYFDLLRNDFGDYGLKIGILHITAPREAVFERARVSIYLTGTRSAYIKGRNIYAFISFSPSAFLFRGAP